MVENMSELVQPIKKPRLHFIAVKNGFEFHYHEKTEFDARSKASQELGWCSDFYQVKDEP